LTGGCSASDAARMIVVTRERPASSSISGRASNTISSAVSKASISSAPSAIALRYAKSTARSSIFSIAILRFRSAADVHAGENARSRRPSWKIGGRDAAQSRQCGGKAEGPAALARKSDIHGLKRRAFECVLAAEERHPHCADLIRSLRRKIAAIA
jgi:hypothetical protein